MGLRRLRRPPRRGLWAALAVAAALAAAGVPAAAQADSATPITIVSAGNPAGQPSVLNVVATDTAASLTSVSAQLSGNGLTTPYSVDLSLASGTATDGTWSAAIPSGALTAGNYTIAVTADDADSNTATSADAGTLAYLFQPALTASTSTTTVSYQNQTVTFSGQLTAVPPGGGTAVAQAGVDIYYTPVGGTPALLATTASDGTYSAVVQNVLPNSWYMTTDATTTVAAAQSNEVTISAIMQAVQVNNLSITPSRVRYGQDVTLTGTVNYGYSTTADVTDSPVQIEVGSTKLPVVDTDSIGNFRATLPSTDGNQVQVTAGEDNSLLTPTTVGTDYSVTIPIKEKQFSAKLEGDGYVSSSVCLLTNPVLFYGAPGLNSVELQYAPTRRGPWRNLGRIPQDPYAGPASCHDGGWAYYTDAEKPLAGRLISAYYRVYVPGSSAYESLTGNAVYSALQRTRIISFNVSPRSVSNGGRITVSGRLQRHGRSWSAYGHQKVFILDRVKGKKKWASIGYVRTGSNGHFSVRLTAGSYRGRLVLGALFIGNSKYLWSQSSQITVTLNGGAVRAILSAAASVAGGYLTGSHQPSSLPRLSPVLGG